MHHRIVSVILSLALTGCSRTAHVPAAIPLESLRVVPGQELEIDVDSGAVKVIGITGDAVEIAGQIEFPQQTTYAVTEAPDRITIHAEYTGRASSSPPIVLNVRLPAALMLNVKTFDAAIELENVSGDITVVTEAGDIHAQGTSGTVVLRSGRGNVTVLGGSGETHVLGEHGVLSLEQVTGALSASTIMGTIRFHGEPGAGDVIYFETDHGPVEVLFGPAANLTVAVSTTSGSLTCVLPGLREISRGCAGRLGPGAGELVIRTVSGAVTFGWSQ